MPATAAMPQRPLNALHEAVAGGLSAAISRAIIAPLDVLKIRFQIQEHPIRHNAQLCTTIGTAQPQPQGVHASHTNVPATPVSHAATSAPLRSVPGAVPAPTSAAVFTSAHHSALASQRVVPPHHATPQYTSLRQAVLLILRQEGGASFWKGNWSALLMVVPYGAVSFTSYKWSKKHIDALHLFDRWPHLQPYERPINHLLSGSFTGAASTLCTYPLDLLRTRFACQRTSN